MTSPLVDNQEVMVPSFETPEAADAATTALLVTSSGSVEVEHSHGVSTIALLSQVFLFAMTLGLSATVEVKHLRQRLGNTYAIGCGVGLQYLVMPCAGLFAVSLLRQVAPTTFTPAMGLTLLVLTSSPGGSYSTWWCSQFNADLPLSVAMTTVSSLLGVLLLPFNLWLSTTLAYGTQASVLELVDFATLLESLALVIAAIVLGLFAGYIWDTPRFHDWANRAGNASGLCLVVLGLLSSRTNENENDHVDNTGSTVMPEATTNGGPWAQPWPLYVGVAIPCLIGIALPNLVARRWLHLSKPETVAIAIECCYQNNGIATSVAIAMFHGLTERTQAVAVPLVYGVFEATIICLYCLWAWKAGWTKAPPGEALWTVITKSYEGDGAAAHPHADEDEEQDEAVMETPLDTVKWVSPESIIGYSPVGVHQVGSLLQEDALETTNKTPEDSEECSTVLAKRLSYDREDTATTMDSFV